MCVYCYIGMSKKHPSIYHRYGIRHLLPQLLCPQLVDYDCHHPTLYINMKGGIKTSLHFDRSCTTFTAAEVHQKNSEHINSDNNNNNNDNNNDDPGKNNLFVQLTGSRTFVLFPPQYCQGGVMMPFEDYHINHISKSTTFLHSVTEHSSNLQKQLKFIEESEFPSLAGPWLHRVVICLHAGDALLIPARWWHYTVVHEPGVALNWWFSEKRNEEKE